MLDADVSVRAVVLVAVGFVHSLQNILSFRKLAENGVLSVQKIDVGAQGNVKLRAIRVWALVHHSQRANLGVLQIIMDFVFEVNALCAFRLRVY